MRIVDTRNCSRSTVRADIPTLQPEELTFKRKRTADLGMDDPDENEVIAIEMKNLFIKIREEATERAAKKLSQGI